MTLSSVKQYVKYATPLIGVIVIVSSVLSAPLLSRQNVEAANNWKTEAGCRKDAAASNSDTTYTTCLNNQSVEGMVYRAYRTILNRNPDTTGFRHWVNVAAYTSNSDPVSYVVNGMLNSQEARNKGVLTENTQIFVQELYQHGLNRKPDVAGLKFWVNEINRMDGKRKTHASVVGSFVQSPEAKSVWSLEAPCYITNYNSRYCAD